MPRIGRKVQTPSVVLRRAQISPEDENYTIEGMTPAQRKNASIQAHVDGWVEVYWLDLEGGKNTSSWKFAQSVWWGFAASLFIVLFWAIGLYAALFLLEVI